MPVKRLLCCYGTRPEFIKIAPIVLELKKRYKKLETILICSGQHSTLLDGLEKSFGISSSRSLDIRDIIGSTDNLSLLAEASHTRFAQVFKELRPSAVLVQGDAAPSFLAALAAFHLHIPIFYVEAGLRTYDLAQPFPEEGYRQMTSRLATYCFAPTKGNKTNLLIEGIHEKNIFVVGNTIIDALQRNQSLLQRNKRREKLLKVNFPWLEQVRGRRIILITIHRRENQGETLKEILTSLVYIQNKNPNHLFVFSVHPNPNVRLLVYERLKNNPGFTLIHPPQYEAFLALLSCVSAVLTDSGGIQEEAPSFGIPTLVLREKTERTESIREGWSLLAGIKEESIIHAFGWINNWKKPKTKNPYGDGKAAKKIAEIIHEHI